MEPETSVIPSFGKTCPAGTRPVLVRVTQMSRKGKPYTRKEHTRCIKSKL